MIDAFYSFSQFAQKLDFQITFVKIPRAAYGLGAGARTIQWRRELGWEWVRGLGIRMAAMGIERNADISAKANIMPWPVPRVM